MGGTNNLPKVGNLKSDLQTLRLLTASVPLILNPGETKSDKRVRAQGVERKGCNNPVLFFGRSPHSRVRILCWRVSIGPPFSMEATKGRPGRVSPMHPEAQTLALTQVPTAW